MAADPARARELLERAYKVVSEANIPESLEEVAFGKAFDLLAGGPPAQPSRAAPAGLSESDTPPAAEGLDLSGAEDFFAAREAGKPHENARLAAAYLYSVYGSDPFSYDDIRVVGEHVGLTLPERLDMTLGPAKSGGKRLFKSGGRGKLSPSVHGEVHMKQQYNVTKGRRKRS